MTIEEQQRKWGHVISREDWKESQNKAKADIGDARQFVENKVRVERAVTWRRSKGTGNNREAMDKIFGKERPLLPICPYGCGREGTLLEVTMLADGRAMGIFNDYPCSCIFIADIQLPEPPRQRKQKLVLGADGEYHMEESENDA